MNRPLALLVFVAVTLAGCAGSPAGVKGNPVGPGHLSDDESLFISGLVVDEELEPVDNATVSVKDHPDTATTDGAGKFKIGPVPPGEYVVTAERAGYASTTMNVIITQGAPNPIRLALKAIALNVPYHESQQHVTFVICASYNLVGGVPCTKLLDYEAGTNVSGSEKFDFPFKIPAPGMVNMSVEMVWTPQPFGHDMLFKIQTPPGQAATALTTGYFAMSGGAPLKGWVTAGIANKGYNNKFDAEPNKVTYDGLTIWSYNNATIPYFSLYLNHRTETWLTEFYNRAGPADWSALPDN